MDTGAGGLHIIDIVDVVDTVDTVNNVKSVDSVDNVNSVDSVNSVQAINNSHDVGWNTKHVRKWYAKRTIMYAHLHENKYEKMRKTTHLENIIKKTSKASTNI